MSQPVLPQPLATERRAVSLRPGLTPLPLATERRVKGLPLLSKKEKVDDSTFHDKQKREIEQSLPLLHL
jgi:hypothetical protein